MGQITDSPAGGASGSLFIKAFLIYSGDDERRYLLPVKQITQGVYEGRWYAIIV
jgi:hypothetical protein